MQQRLGDYRLFFREFFRTFHTTGSIVPSSAGLSRALASRIQAQEHPQHVLEVGPGTGVVTSWILQRLGPHDRLDLVELNPRFALALRQRLASDSQWKPFAERVQVLETPFQEVEVTTKYDAMVSGLPLNNFSVQMVEEILQAFHRMAKPEATLSFFEYVAVRKFRGLTTKQAERLRLSGVERLLDEEFDRWQTARQCIVANFPPAWVHHLTLPGYNEMATPKHVAKVPSATSSQ